MSQQLTCNDEIGITSNQPIISQNQHENDKENMILLIWLYSMHFITTI